MKSKDFTILVLSVALIASILIWARGCNGGPDADTLARLEKKTADSLAFIQKEQAAFNVIANLTKEGEKKDSVIQVALIEKELTEKELHRTSNRVVQLTRAINLARGQKDTVEIVLTCDSLATVAEELTQLIRSYENDIDTIIGNYEQSLKVKDEIIAVSKAQYNVLRSAYDVLGSDYRQALENRPKQKRFSVGPVIGYGVGKDGLTPFAGIGVQYQLFKF